MILPLARAHFSHPNKNIEKFLTEYRNYINTTHSIDNKYLVVEYRWKHDLMKRTTRLKYI
ncbi:hypothetical protein M2387_004871 [Klebsiella sp. BIGb0407]|nr:hypothetical protein [Klebsiella sp. BIGb0407]